MRPNPNNYVHLGLKTIFLYQKHLRTLQNKYFNSKNQAQKNFFDVKKNFFSKFFSSKIFWKLKNWKSRLASTFEQFFSKDCRCQNMNGTSKILPKMKQATSNWPKTSWTRKKRLWNFDLPYTGPYTGISGSRIAV